MCHSLLMIHTVDWNKQVKKINQHMEETLCRHKQHPLQESKVYFTIYIRLIKNTTKP